MKVEQLFLDLDGVLADFDRGVERITGHHPSRLSPRQMWSRLANHGDFFNTLEMMEDAQALWAFCEPHGARVLTGLPRGAWAAPQKRRWVARMLGADVEVITCMSHEKPRWSGPGRVLVDDRARAREPWEARGGVFILHTSAQASIARLRALGLGGAP